MLLRRINQHVRNQNWFAVFLDFIIVVAGVFIGIQVANWNEALGDKELERQYIKKLAKDIHVEIVAFEEVEHGLVTSLSITDKLFEEALNEQLSEVVKMSSSAKTFASDKDFLVPESIEITDLDKDYFLTFSILTRVFNEENSTFDTLKSTGHIRVISNKSISYSLADYYANIKNIIYFEGGTVRDMRNRAAFLAIRNGLNPYGRNSYDAVINSIQSDPEFAAALRTMRNINVFDHVVINNTKQMAYSLVDELTAGD